MAVKNSLTKTESTKKAGISAYLLHDAVKAQINNVVGKDGQRFIASVVSAVTVNPELQDCSNASILSAALQGESLKLSPSPQLGAYYMVPYDGNDGKVAQFQIGYKGYIQLAIRSGQYKKLNVLAIKEGELVSFDPLTEEIEVNLIEDEELREKTSTVGYYAMYELINGFRKAIYWSRKKMESHALKYSQGYKKDKEKGWSYSFWSKDFDAMACKTMIRQLIGHYGVMSVEFETAYTADMAVINEDGSKEYVDNIVEGEATEIVNEEPAKEPEPIAGEQAQDDIAAALFDEKGDK